MAKGKSNKFGTFSNPYVPQTVSNGIATISTSSNGASTLNVPYATYHILGEDFQTTGYVDGYTAVLISTLNVLGRPFYEELKKNKVSFTEEMDNFIQMRLRDEKISTILNEK
jgi:hypothetical protein